MKVTTGCTLLIILVVGSIVSAEDNGICVEKCTEECKATCPEQIVCTKDELDCGPGTPPENPFCEVDRVCVASNCNCKYLYKYIGNT